MIDILTLNYNDSKTTIEFVKSVEQFSIVSHIVVVDNLSTDDSFNKLSELNSEKVFVIQNSSNKGYGSGNNFGINYIKQNFNTQRILLSNPDVIIEEMVIESLNDYMSQNKRCAICAPYMCDKFGNKQVNSAFRVPNLFQYILSIDAMISKYYTPMRYEDLEKIQIPSVKVGCVSGACFMLDIDKFMSVGGFDEHIFLYCEEVVIGKKMQSANYDIVILPNNTFIHNHSVSITKTYSSIISRQKILYKSKIYVINKYYNSSVFISIITKMMAKISLMELYLKEKILLWRKE